MKYGTSMTLKGLEERKEDGCGIQRQNNEINKDSRQYSTVPVALDQVQGTV